MSRAWIVAIVGHHVARASIAAVPARRWAIVHHAARGPTGRVEDLLSAAHGPTGRAEDLLSPVRDPRVPVGEGHQLSRGRTAGQPVLAARPTDVAGSVHGGRMAAALVATTGTGLPGDAEAGTSPPCRKRRKLPRRTRLSRNQPRRSKIRPLRRARALLRLPPKAMMLLRRRARGPRAPNGLEAWSFRAVACATEFRLAPRKRGEAATRSVAGEGTPHFAVDAAPHPRPLPGFAGARGYKCLGWRKSLDCLRSQPVRCSRWLVANATDGKSSL